MNAHSLLIFSSAQIFTSDFALVHFHHFERAEGNVSGGHAEYVSSVVSGTWQSARRDAKLEESIATAFHRLHGFSYWNVLSTQTSSASVENAVRRNLASSRLTHVVGKVLWGLRETASSIVIRGNFTIKTLIKLINSVLDRMSFLRLNMHWTWSRNSFASTTGESFGERTRCFS